MNTANQEKRFARVRSQRCPHCGKLIAGEFPEKRCCKICGAVKPIAEFAKANKNAFGFSYECKPCWNANHRKVLRQKERDRDRKNRETLSDKYIRHMLVGHSKLKHSDFPPELIALKRAQIKLTRSLNQRNK